MKLYRYMKPSLVALALAIALPAAAQVGYRYDDYANSSEVRDDYARVVRVDAIVNHASSPTTRETCWQEPTTYRYLPGYTYYKDGDDDSGPEAVTVEGQYRTVSSAQQRCRTQTDWRSTDRVLGYEVTYRYGGREYQTRMDHDPGNRLRVRVNYDTSITPDE